MIGAIRRSRALALPLAIALVAAACSGSSQPDDTPGSGGGPDDPGVDVDLGREPEPVVIDVGRGEIILTARLVRFDECDALLEHLRSEATARVGPWGFGGHLYEDSDDMIGEEMMAAEDVGAPTLDSPQSSGPAADFERQPPVEGVDYSGTNVQEAGVDEADIIKTDGRRIFAMSAGRLVVVDAASREVLGSVLLPLGESAELFLHGDSLLAIQQTGGRGTDPPQAVVHRIDVRDGVPEIVETIRVEGSYVSARSIGGVARVILRSQPVDDFPFVYPSGADSEATAEEANRASMLASTLEDWLPAYSHTSHDGATTEGLLAPCAQVHAPTVFSGFGVTTVLSVPVAGAIDPASATSVLAPGETVYASLQSLYVSTTTWIDPSADEAGDVDWDQVRAEFRTNIHRFDISDPAGAVYTASGNVPGEIHNQFALSEHAGHLRVVTTTGAGSTASETWVRVLTETDGELVEVSSVGDIGRGERVQSVRFAGDVGYVVTFRQIDPFYMIDLSDPAEPTVIGELKIPGFSSYLHPIGDGLVLGVGSDADEDGRVTGAKVSLFDVSNLADPREVSVWTAPSGWNNIGWDHRAFLWWAPERLAVIPVTVDYEWSGAVVLKVTDGAIEETGRITPLEDQKTGASADTCRDLTAADVINSSGLSEDEFPEGADTGAFVAWTLLYNQDYPWLMLACGVGEAGSRAGLVCEFANLTPEDVASIRGRLAYGAAEDMWACLEADDREDRYEAPARQIVRSIVIGDDLWTLSHPYRRYGNEGTKGLLEVNDLASLGRLASVNL